ncbi:MAG: LTA synthase family protein, partial [Muribaculaceae bacterium]|nr:LTA synthase family protein [Muribaculaceae bacterium]
MSAKFHFLKNRFAALYAGTFLALIYFCIDWSMQTTFRGMSFWELYVTNALLALLLMLPYMLSRKVWVQGVTIGVADCALIANLMYRRTYFTPIPPESYLMAGNLGDFGASVVDSLHWLDAGFPVLLAATLWLAYRLPQEESPRRWRNYLAAAALLSATVAVGLMAKGGFGKVMRKLSSSCYYNTTPVQIYTPAGYLIYTAMETDDELTPEVRARVDLWLRGKERLRPYKGLPDSVAPRKNLVVILLESFEGWLPENEINGKPITPYINSLLKDSATLFAPRVLSQVSTGRSIDGQLLIFTGLLPRLHTIYSTKHPGNFYPTLNKALREKYGAKSYIFTCDRPVTWNQQAVSPAFGYDTMYSRDAWELDDLIGKPAKLSDQSFFRQSADLIAKSDLWPEGEPRLLTFVSYSGHNPWILPEEKKDPDFDLHAMGFNKRFADYTTMAHYTDGQLHICRLYTS